MKEFEKDFEKFILDRENHLYKDLEKCKEYKELSNRVTKKHVEILKKLKEIGEEELMDDVTILLDLTDERNDFYTKKLYGFAFAEATSFLNTYIL